jgi:hypothetical protein
MDSEMVRFCSFVCALLLVLVCGCGENPFADSGQSGGKSKPADADPQPQDVSSGEPESGGVDAQLQAMQDLADIIGRFADALEKIDGEESAKASVPQLNSLLDEMRQCGEKAYQLADSGAEPEYERFKPVSRAVYRSNYDVQDQIRRLRGLSSVREALTPVMTRFGQLSVDFASKAEAKASSIAKAENQAAQDSKATVKIINVQDSTAGRRMTHEERVTQSERSGQIARELRKSCGGAGFSARTRNGVSTITITAVRDFDQLVAYAKKMYKVTNVDKAARVITIDSDGAL